MEAVKVENRTVLLAGSMRAKYCLIEPIGPLEDDALERQLALIGQMCKDISFCYLGLVIENWNQELSPWKAKAVFGKDDFGEGAKETLAFLQEVVIPYGNAHFLLDPKQTSYVLGGYSLAGLFALWSGYTTDFFRKIAAVSPSVWFPEWEEWTGKRPLQTTQVYLSLGKKESQTRNRTMARVAQCIEEQYQQTRQQLGEAACVLEWNEGNHFREPEIRVAKGFSWLIQKEQGL